MIFSTEDLGGLATHVFDMALSVYTLHCSYYQRGQEKNSAPGGGGGGRWAKKIVLVERLLAGWAHLVRHSYEQHTNNIKPFRYLARLASDKRSRKIINCDLSIFYFLVFIYLGSFQIVTSIGLWVKGGGKHIGEEVEYCGKAGFDQGGWADGGEDIPFWLFYNQAFTYLYIYCIFEYSIDVYLGRGINLHVWVF